MSGKQVPGWSVLIVAEWFPDDKAEGLRREHKGREELRVSRRMYEALRQQDPHLEGLPVEFERFPPGDFIWLVLRWLGIVAGILAVLVYLVSPR